MEPEAFVSTDMAGALRALVDRDFLKSEKFQEQQWRATRKGADSEILDFERLFIRRFAKLGIPMWAATVMRSEEDQSAAYVLGTSNAPAGKSPHQRGGAIDLVHGTRGWELSKDKAENRRMWALIVHIGNEVARSAGIDLVNGSTFKTLWDPAHWELSYWRDLPYRA